MKFDYKKVEKTEEFEYFKKEFNHTVDFLESFSNLIWSNGRIISFITDQNFHFLNTNLLDNSVQTLRSIELCCSIGSFTDANTLVRKLRDDLLLYIFILTVINQRKPFIEEDLEKLNLENAEDFASSFLNLRLNTNLTDNEKAVDAWLSNKVLDLPRNIKMKLSFENYMKFLKQDENINKILTQYNLQGYWNTLRNKLNNYVHNNGKQFTAHNLIKYNNQNLKVYFQNINIRTTYIINFFLVLIIMTESSLISSGDINDYLECGLEPPEGCQYEIAPIIQDYIDKEVVKLHPELKEFLKDNNNYGMRIS